MIEITEVPDGATITLVANVNTFRSSLNGFQQYSTLPGSRWGVSLAWTNRKGREASRLQAQLSALLGPVGIFKIRIPDYKRYGSAAGTGEVVSAVVGSSLIETSGWTPSQPLLLAAGDWIEINQQAYRVTADVASAANGTASIQVSPPVRRAATAGQSVIVDDPSFYLRLTNSNGAEFALTPAAGSPIYAVGIDALEID